MPRFHCPAPLATGTELDLPPGAARHVQVLRLQPGDGITLFHGGQGAGDPGGEFDATVLKMGRSDVRVLIGLNIDGIRDSCEGYFGCNPDGRESYYTVDDQPIEHHHVTGWAEMPEGPAP